MPRMWNCPTRDPVGPTGGNAHSLLGVERNFLQESTTWLLAKVPASASFLSSRPRPDQRKLPALARRGPDSRLVTSGGDTVTLNGRNSVDLDGTLVSYAWTQTDGRAVRLNGANSPQASFDIPRSTSTLEFALTVTDNSGATATDTVTVDVVGLQLGGGTGSPDFLVLGVLALLRTVQTKQPPGISTQLGHGVALKTGHSSRVSLQEITMSQSTAVSRRTLVKGMGALPLAAALSGGPLRAQNRTRGDRHRGRAVGSQCRPAP